MANSGAIRAGRAFVELFADDGPLKRGLNAASARLKAWGSSIASLGAQTLAVGTAITAPFVAASQVFSEMGGNLADMSQRTGASVESLSALGYAADLSATSMEAVEKSLKKMQINLTDAANGSESAASAFENLGLSVDELLKLSPDEQLLAIGEALYQIPDPALKAALAVDALGKSGTELLPLFNDGADGVRGMMEEAKRLGLVISTDAATKAEAFGDEIDKLWKVLKQSAFVIGGAVAPAINRFVQTVTVGVVKINAWIRENEELITTVFKVGAAIAVAGAALVALGAVVSGLGSVLAGIASAIGLVTAAISFLLTPIGAVIGGLAGLATYFVTATETGSAAVKNLYDDSMTAFGGIADALLSGNISQAGKILWSLLKLEWTRGINFLSETWDGLWDGVSDAVFAAQQWISKQLITSWSNLQKNWNDVTSFLADGWSSFTHGAIELWNDVQDVISAGWLDLQGLFDNGIDVAAGKARIAAQAAERENAGKKVRESEKQKIESDRVAALHEIVAEERGTLEQLNKLRDQRNTKKDAERASRAAAAEAEVAAAQADLTAAVAEARKKGIENPTAEDLDLIRSKKRVQDLAQEAENAFGEGNVSGTFSAAVAGTLGGRNVAEKQLDEQKKTNERLDKVVEVSTKAWETLKFV